MWIAHAPGMPGTFSPAVDFTMHLPHITQHTIQNMNIPLYVLNGILWDMGQVNRGICDIGVWFIDISAGCPLFPWNVGFTMATWIVRHPRGPLITTRSYGIAMTVSIFHRMHHVPFSFSLRELCFLNTSAPTVCASNSQYMLSQWWLYMSVIASQITRCSTVS